MTAAVVCFGRLTAGRRRYLGMALLDNAFIFSSGLRSDFMAFPIRNRVPYQVTHFGIDLGSGRSVTNTFYYRNKVQTVSPPAYGAGIAGAGSTATLLASCQAIWITAILTRLNHNYSLLNSVMQAILGKRYSSPLVPIQAVTVANPAVIATASPHGLSTGDVVSVTGVTAPSDLNGAHVITVTSPTTFTFPYTSFVSPWSGDGYFQLAEGAIEFQYADKESLPIGATFGQVAGDALPLFATSSVRRLNGGIGRSFRSRFSLSPMSETDSLDGGFTAAQKALMVTALGNFVVARTNGGTDATSGLSDMCAVSKQIGFGLSSPFIASDPFTATVTSMVQQPNTGSLVRRKPRLTGVII